MYEIFLTSIDDTIETVPENASRSNAGAVIQSGARDEIDGRWLLAISWIAPLAIDRKSVV